MDPDRKIYIGGLPDDANKFDVEDAFARIGRVTDVWVARSPPGFAFLEMEDKRDAEDACRELDGTRICGNRVEVKMSRDGGRGVGGGSMRRSRSPIWRRTYQHRIALIIKYIFGQISSSNLQQQKQSN